MPTEINKCYYHFTCFGVTSGFDAFVHVYWNMHIKSFFYGIK